MDYKMNLSPCFGASCIDGRGWCQKVGKLAKLPCK